MNELILDAIQSLAMTDAALALRWIDTVRQRWDYGPNEAYILYCLEMWCVASLR